MTGLTEAVVRNLFKLMAYKDEYEVARLYTSGDFEAKLAKQFEGDYKLHFNLAPPLISRRDSETGELQKRQFGPWMLSVFRLLAKFRRLRGSRLDIFGWTAERRRERRLISDYGETLEELIGALDGDNHATAVRIAEVPAAIRGYGHVKERNVRDAVTIMAELKEAFRRPDMRATAAE